MQRILALAVLAVFLVGCATERPRYGASVPPSTPPAAHVAHPAPAEMPAGPMAVKPLGRGALAANLVEGYMDNQEGALRGVLRGVGATVGRQGDELVLNLRSDALFGTGSTAIAAQGRGILTRVAYVVRKFDSTQLAIGGYTDTTGTPEQNLQVSRKRADAVSAVLSEQGVDARRIAAKGYGETSLRIPTGPNVSDARNRRIEIRITPQVKA